MYQYWIYGAGSGEVCPLWSHINIKIRSVAGLINYIFLPHLTHPYPLRPSPNPCTTNAANVFNSTQRFKRDESKVSRFTICICAGVISVINLMAQCKFFFYFVLFLPGLIIPLKSYLERFFMLI